VARVPQVEASYALSRQRLGVRAGTPEGRDVGAAMRELCEAGSLPLPRDRVWQVSPEVGAQIERTTGRRTIDLYVHRVRKRAGRRDLWILYRVTPTRVVFVLLTAVPPPL
jgi:hypothetical protein